MLFQGTLGRQQVATDTPLPVVVLIVTVQTRDTHSVAVRGPDDARQPLPRLVPGLRVGIKWEWGSHGLIPESLLTQVVHQPLLESLRGIWLCSPWDNGGRAMMVGENDPHKVRLLRNHIVGPQTMQCRDGWIDLYQSPQENSSLFSSLGQISGEAYKAVPFFIESK